MQVVDDREISGIPIANKRAGISEPSDLANTNIGQHTSNERYTLEAIAIKILNNDSAIAFNVLREIPSRYRAFTIMCSGSQIGARLIISS